MYFAQTQMHLYTEQKTQASPPRPFLSMPLPNWEAAWPSHKVVASSIQTKYLTNESEPHPAMILYNNIFISMHFYRNDQTEIGTILVAVKMKMVLSIFR